MATSTLTPRIAVAQDMPATTRIIVPFPGGSPVETAIRALVQSLNKTSGRNYIVENKPGATGLLGAADAARAKGDGSTLLLVTGGFSTTEILYKKLPYDTFKDFRTVTRLLTSPGFALMVGPKSPYRNVDELLKAAKAKPNAVTYASMGNGGVTHLIAALFGHAVGAEFLHVPYKSSAMPDLIGGHVDTHWLSTSIARPLVTSGQVRVLAVSAPTRMPEAPDAPTLAEMGMKDIYVPAWSGFLAPKSTPDAITSRIYDEIATAAKSEEFIAYIKAAGNELIVSTPQQFDTHLRTEIEHFRKLLPPLGIKMD